MVHENSDAGQMLTAPLGYRVGRPLSGLMTLQNFIDGGYDVVDAKVLVIAKSIGAVIRSQRSLDQNLVALGGWRFRLVGQTRTRTYTYTWQKYRPTCAQ